VGIIRGHVILTSLVRETRHTTQRATAFMLGVLDAFIPASTFGGKSVRLKIRSFTRSRRFPFSP
jgi:hypothetical protein